MRFPHQQSRRRLGRVFSFPSENGPMRQMVDEIKLHPPNAGQNELGKEGGGSFCLPKIDCQQ